MPESPEIQRPLSAVLADVAYHEGERISVAELTQLFGGRAIGALLFVFGLACLLPLPPGATTIFGFPLVLLAPQLIIGAAAPWLPDGIRHRTISTSDLKKGLPRLVGALRKVEAVSKPRLAFMFGPVGERLIGVVVLVLALVLILPIPGGNMLPALAVSALSFALIQRDGLIALLGYLIAVVSASILVAAAHIIVRMFVHFWAVISPA
ncbi:exopolysaccharide biosynthesis protein [Phenylobacterium sp.]|uniref:exopolysaccharide biosynthesis protein n=1 Tax=Phenylobacterium sp. TaxID=1871053 RepID=UPI0025E2D395|nr:exopolysaccharide biosynthesis protein [Phenylobacterium sp.]MBX3484349.1 exopolysaccharide biosynthesis protein [Phenylobacterium sp.]MCW5761381.1 exopolysaccharide biosynthesis protein [Phenylobacterium sp.]